MAISDAEFQIQYQVFNKHIDSFKEWSEEHLYNLEQELEKLKNSYASQFIKIGSKVFSQDYQRSFYVYNFDTHEKDGKVQPMYLVCEIPKNGILPIRPEFAFRLPLSDLTIVD